MSQPNKTSGLYGAVHKCSSWDDIQGKLRPLSDKQKGDTFEELVKAYLLLSRNMRVSSSMSGCTGKFPLR